MSTLDEAIAAMEAVRTARDRLSALKDDRKKTKQRLDDLDQSIVLAQSSLDDAKKAAKTAVSGAL